MKPQRIAVIGIGGSGKSVLARKLAKQSDLPLFHMDALFWKGNWQAVSESEYIKDQEKLLAENNRWIIEGYVDEALVDRLEVADLVVYLDYSGPLCFWRVIRRWLQHRKESRPELPKEALERLDWKFLRVVLTRGERPGIEKALSHIDPSKVIRFKSPAAANEFQLN